jgi:uncharacterized protein (TIGR02246 family)
MRGRTERKDDHVAEPIEEPGPIEELESVPLRMYEAWNRGDVEGFFADFAEDVVFAELEGTLYRSRAAAVAAHEELFATALKGSRLVGGEVLVARIVAPGVGVVHSRVGILMPGEEEPPDTRYSMQLFVTVWREGRWVVVALENARRLSLAGMAALETLG